MLTLGIDTSNYATSLAVLDTATKEVVCDIKNFLPVVKGGLGLRQSDALFHHTVALPTLLAQISQKVDLTQIEAVGVSEKPRPIEGSYMPCFLAGVSVAEAFALSRNLPVVRTSHQQGHIAAALYATKQPNLWKQSVLLFHISGGTTELLLCNGLQIVDRVGTTLDLYAGQAVDRIGVKLGLDFPAGVQLSQLALHCTEKIANPKICIKGMDCSLSGLENQCNALLKSEKSKEYIAKFCLTAIAQTVIKMIQKANEKYDSLPIVCAGGVMSSEIIRNIVQKQYPQTYFVDGRFSSDNAIGIAWIAGQEAYLGRGNLC